MGSTRHPAEQPVHSVTIPAFEMARTEVTVAEYQQCVQAGSCSSPDTGGSCNWGRTGTDLHPVNCVTWDEAVDFCQWAEGRLPSEAEWEYAARGGGQNVTYPWGQDMATCHFVVMNDSSAGGSGCGTAGTLPVCSRTDGNTPQGLCDMAGNGWEWIRDWWHPSYFGAPTDGSAWESPPGPERVLRGGSWDNDLEVYFRVATRSDADPHRTFDVVGFRCARSP